MLDTIRTMLGTSPPPVMEPSEGPAKGVQLPHVQESLAGPKDADVQLAGWHGVRHSARARGPS